MVARGWHQRVPIEAATTLLVRCSLARAAKCPRRLMSMRRSSSSSSYSKLSASATTSGSRCAGASSCTMRTSCRFCCGFCFWQLAPGALRFALALPSALPKRPPRCRGCCSTRLEETGFGVALGLVLSSQGITRQTPRCADAIGPAEAAQRVSRVQRAPRRAGGRAGGSKELYVTGPVAEWPLSL